MLDDGDGDIDIVFIAGDIRGVDVDGDGGGGSDIGVDGDDIECLADPLRLCFLYLTCLKRKQKFLNQTLDSLEASCESRLRPKIH